ncbi:2-dehydro-3-deoxygalactonokinase [Acidovorax sp. LjRoot118]|uniref:2-dehydro-3-deoxygalactonokinase n=1 Tax=Acidovorax sp. LjRoot118 TaxID=3342256 RepID=UPI003ED07219
MTSNTALSNGAAALIGLDWGTSSLRAFRFDAAGAVQEMRHRPWGIMNLPVAANGQAHATQGAAFEHAFDDVCGDWVQARPGIPVLACGMVGSAQGWREARYLESPASLDHLARGLTLVEHSTGPRVHIVPGLLQRGDLPNVMRGEETQVLGVMAASALPGDAPVLIGLPGTHSKWVLARRRSIEQFHTFMTGEVFAALRGHTILGRTMQPAEAPDDAAFARGLQVARSAEASLGLLSHIFSTRTLGLTGALPATAQADYLSGLLIGHEVAALAAQQEAGATPAHIVLCGEPDLCRRYALALAACGLPAPEMADNATARGLWQIATAAALVTPTDTQAARCA